MERRDEELGSRVRVQSVNRACELRSEGNALSDWPSRVVEREIVQTKCRDCVQTRYDVADANIQDDVGCCETFKDSFQS